MKAKLPWIELVFYNAVWIPWFIWAVHGFYDFCRELEKDNWFASWATFPGYFLNFKYREKFDHDIGVIFHHGPMYIVVGLGQVLLRWIIFGLIITRGQENRRKLLSLFLTCYGIFGITSIFGQYYAAFFVALAVTNYVLVHHLLTLLPIIRNFSPLLRVWCIAIMQTFSVHHFMEYTVPYRGSEFDQIVFIWSMGWYQLRLVSYVDMNNRFKTNFIDFMAYVFYFPTFFAPFVSYARFVRDNDLVNLDDETLREIGGKNKERTIGEIFVIFVKQYLYILIWAVLTLFMNHAFFPIAYVYYEDKYLESPLSSRIGHLWVLGQWFQSKYMLLYGGPWIMTLLDTGCSLPPIPIFISRVYRYSVMWRKFDTGLYEFMRDHLYGPALATIEHIAGFLSPVLKKMFALAATYFFVGIWHGLSSSVLLFAAMNFFGLLAEYTAKGINRKYKIYETMSPQWHRRLSAFLYMIGVQWSWFSFFIFTTDYKRVLFIINNTYLQKGNGLAEHSMAFLTFYCWVQIAMELEDWLDESRPTNAIAAIDDEEEKVKTVTSKGKSKRYESKKRR